MAKVIYFMTNGESFEREFKLYENGKTAAAMLYTDSRFVKTLISRGDGEPWETIFDKTAEDS